jgi:cell division protein FtsN
LQELKSTLTEERDKFLTDLAEEVSETAEETSTSSEATTEKMAESEASLLAESPPVEAALSSSEGEKTQKEKKEEPGGAKEGVPSHG